MNDYEKYQQLNDEIEIVKMTLYYMGVPGIGIRQILAEEVVQNNDLPELGSLKQFLHKYLFIDEENE